jgi:hypothetical protein
MIISTIRSWNRANDMLRSVKGVLLMKWRAYTPQNVGRLMKCKVQRT